MDRHSDDSSDHSVDQTSAAATMNNMIRVANTGARKSGGGGGGVGGAASELDELTAVDARQMGSNETGTIKLRPITNKAGATPFLSDARGLGPSLDDLGIVRQTSAGATPFIADGRALPSPTPEKQAGASASNSANSADASASSSTPALDKALELIEAGPRGIDLAGVAGEGAGGGGEVVVPSPSRTRTDVQGSGGVTMEDL